jgi:hypothetical protein
MQVTAKLDAYKTGGASLHQITILTGAKSTPDEKKKFEKTFGKGGIKAYVGVAGSGWLVFAIDKDKTAKALAAKVVAGAKQKAAQGKSALGKVFDDAIADSKSRGESGLMVFDLSSVAADPVAAKGAQIVVGIGFDGAVMKSRVTVPPATARALGNRKMGP